MFPKNWDDQRTMEEIAYVRERLTTNNLISGNEYHGQCTANFIIGMYVDDLTNFDLIRSAFTKP